MSRYKSWIHLPAAMADLRIFKLFSPVYRRLNPVITGAADDPSSPVRGNVLHPFFVGYFEKVRPHFSANFTEDRIKELV
jgi:hypothetical protein